MIVSQAMIKEKAAITKGRNNVVAPQMRSSVNFDLSLLLVAKSAVLPCDGQRWGGMPWHARCVKRLRLAFGFNRFRVLLLALSWDSPT